MEREERSPWAPFTYKIFAVVWTATVVSNIGTWMYSAAAGWLMTDLTRNAFTISLVQVASNFPVFLFALVAGALSDILDKRRYLIAGEIATTILSAAFAAMVWFHDVTPGTLLLFMFLIAAAGALTAPAWQAVVPELVPRKVLPAAVSANSAGINVSRAIGPAIAGEIIRPFGIVAPFIANAVSNLGVIGALILWRPAKKTESGLPAERFTNAMRRGLRYALNSAGLRATFVRIVAFFLFASAYWALLPLIARDRIGGGPEIYGLLLGAIGIGAVGGAFMIPALTARIGPDRLVGAAGIGTALALVMFALARDPLTALVASLIAGVCWIATIASVGVSAQVSVPDWVRGRGLAMYLTVFFGSMTAGSALWGQLAGAIGVPRALLAAAVGVIIAIPLTWRWKLQTSGTIDLTPSAHWPTPVVSREVANDRGPVLVTLEYRVAHHKDVAAFVSSMNRLRRERLRDGAYQWGIFEDIAEPRRFLETFYIESWIEHLRQHQRVTNADRYLQEHVNGLLEEPVNITHLVAPPPK
ncbi:MAG TPA: MFS transporter [Candidatus Rubrimentiphilum sp.]|nr:MFS transporter [Candidatus Rubrimentiphilum sp.]